VRFGKRLVDQNKLGPQNKVLRTKPDVEPGPEINITSDLQITDGKFKGKILANSKSPKCIPTPRGLREIMFRMLFRRIRGGRFLDLCAGCGMMGLEAISRGSMLSTFVESSSCKSSFLRKNIAELGIKNGHCEVFEIEAAPFLARSAKRKRHWDVVFLGRVNETCGAELISLLSRGSVIEPGGVAVFEHSAEQPLPETIGSLKQWRTLIYHGSSLSFYSRK